MIGTLRALFLLRPLREKILVVALVAVVVVFWLSNLVGRAQSFTLGATATTAELADQAQWIAHRAAILASANQAAGQLDAARTLDATRLLATVSALAREAGLRNTTSGELQNVGSGQFAVHTLPFNVTRSDWDSLKAFYVALQKYSPYIGIELMSIQADRANAAQLNATFRLSSVEIASSGHRVAP